MTHRISVNLKHEELNLWECGKCFALVLKESQRLHEDWHRELQEQLTRLEETRS